MSQRNIGPLIAGLFGVASLADATEPGYFQVGVGALDIQDPGIQVSLPDEAFSGEFPDEIYQLGGGVQTPWSDGVFGAGWEGGGFVNWITDDVSVFVLSNGGTTAKVSVDSLYFAMETFLGLYGSLQPVPWFRLYAGAGPSLTIGLLDVGEEESEDLTPEQQTVVVNLNESNFVYGAGYYGRVGMDFFVKPDLSIGLGARYQNSRLNTGGSIERVDLEGIMLMLTVGGRI